MKAFPRTRLYVYEDGRLLEEAGDKGMDLRDYFAAKAMQALISRDGSIKSKKDIEKLPELSYLIADAMIK